MEKRIKKDKTSEKNVLYIIMELILGLIVFSVGAFIFRWEMVGSRGWEITEGVPAQIIGIVLIIYGLYSMVSAIRKLRFKLNERKD